MIYGRGSIFFLCSIFFFNGIGLCMLYFIVFGDTFATFIASLVGETLWSVWYTHRYIYSLPLAVLLLPVVLKKELAEFAWISYVLFVSLGLFIVTNFIELVFDDHFEAEGVSTEILKPKIHWGTISALSAVMVAYSYQQNVMPIYSELRNKTNEEYKKVSLGGLPLTGSIYVMVGIICSLMFGDKLQSSILLNLGEATWERNGETHSFWEAWICQVSFCIVLCCHVPFIFFSAKEAVLIMVDELQRKSISNALWHKLQGNEVFSKDPRHSEAPNPNLPCPGDDSDLPF